MWRDVKKGNKCGGVGLKVGGEGDGFVCRVEIGIRLMGIVRGMYWGNKIGVEVRNVVM